LNANELKEAAQKLADQLRKARQTQWARELEDILAAGPANNQMLGEIITVLRRLNTTNLPPMLGMSETLTKLIADIEKFFKTKK
jgi:type II secretory pathway component PulF